VDDGQTTNNYNNNNNNNNVINFTLDVEFSLLGVDWIRSIKVIRKPVAYDDDDGILLIFSVWFN